MGLKYIHTPYGTHQADLTVQAVYGAEYLSERYAAIEGKVWALARRRVAVLDAFVPRGRLLDFGCGTGRFLAVARVAGWNAWGHDLTRIEGVPYAAALAGFDVVTFFDSLEHLPDPAHTLRELAAPVVLISVPECHAPQDDWFRTWKHRRPGEHLWHWNRFTLDAFMGRLDYRPIMHSSFEDDVRVPYDPALTNILTAIYRRRA